ncbi:MAG: TlpA disulfide reductase family protein [Candidatus Thalassarchaeaceae archaeon]|nr:TlpA disulfide reductase family protein [Candidatus Thalassarchaeaceae archaeon]
MSRRRRMSEPKGKDDDVRLIAALATMGIVTIVGLAAILVSPPVKVGPLEGEIAPDFIESAYSGSGWDSFRLTESYDDRKVLITFLDTDCPHCWEEGETLTNLHSIYKDDVQFITIAVELSITGHESSREEIEAFRDKTNHNGCYSGNQNCVDRPGNAHTWTYIDDIDTSIAKNWEVPGTPFNIILDSNGEVIWNQAQSENHPNEDVEQALARLVG